MESLCRARVIDVLNAVNCDVVFDTPQYSIINVVLCILLRDHGFCFRAICIIVSPRPVPIGSGNLVDSQIVIDMWYVNLVCLPVIIITDIYQASH